MQIAMSIYLFATSLAGVVCTVGYACEAASHKYQKENRK